ncbi:threonine aldolase, partial [Fulvivirga sp. RKSG066]|uniref:threonine aldolase family protein n=1 Tax=Fulvivirga aurantia TaxID=2529383 RepID=UPI0012BD2576
PTSEMLEVMMQAKVGDDVFGEDPNVNLLEQKCAEMFNMEASIFCPSGTMTNQIGINVLSRPYEEIICYKGAHIYKYEGGGIAGNSGLSFRLLEGDRGVLDLDEILANINVDDIHFPVTSIVELENTVNKGGGKCYTLEEISSISNGSRAHGMKMHLDGARLFNALVATGDKSEDYGHYFDTISICLSKGLGAPVGSILLGSNDLMKQARRVRKYFGGGMRQAGYLAAAGIYALDNHVDRLAQDHHRAKQLEVVLKNQGYVKEVLPVETNIVIFELQDGITAEACLDKLKAKGVLAVPFGPSEVRFVTHLDYDDDMLEKTVQAIKTLSF